MEKTFIMVRALFTTDGQIIPEEIFWSDGRRYEIDRILDVREAPSLKYGGQGKRYTCMVKGKEIYLFCDENQWFIG